MKMLLLTFLAGITLTFGNPFSREDAEKLREEMVSMKEQLTGMRDVINVNGIVDKAKIISSEMTANDIKSLEELASLGDELELSLKDMEKHDVKFNAKEVKEQMDEIMQNVRSKVQPKPAEDEKTLMSLISSAKEVVADTKNDLPSKIASVKKLESIADSISSKLKDLKAKKSQIDFKFFKDELTKVKKDAEQKFRMSPVKDQNNLEHVSVPEIQAKDENYLSSLITKAKKIIADTTEDMESKIKSVKELNSIVSDFSTTLINLKAEKADLDVKSFKDEIEIVKKDAEAKFGEKEEDTKSPKKDFSYLHVLMKDAKQAVLDASNDVDSKKKALEKVDWLTSEFADDLKGLKEDDVKADIDQFKEEVLGLQEDLKNKFLDKEEHDEVKEADVYENLVGMTQQAKKVVAEAADLGSDETSKLDALNELKAIKEEFKVAVKDAMNQHMDIDYKALLEKLKDVEKSIKPVVDSIKRKKDESNKAKNEVNNYLFGLARDAKEIVADVVNDNTQMSQTESLNKLKSLETEFKDVINDASEKNIDVEYNKLYDQLKDVEKGVDSIIHAKDEKEISVAKKTEDDTNVVEKVSDNDSLLELTKQVNAIVANIGSDKASQDDALHKLEALKPVFKEIVKDVKMNNIDVEYNKLEAQLKDAEMAVIAKKDEFAPRQTQSASKAPAAPDVPQPEAPVPDVPQPEAPVPAAPDAPQPEAPVPAAPYAPQPEADAPAALDAPQPEADAPAALDAPQPEADAPAALDAPQPEADAPAALDAPQPEAAAPAALDAPQPEADAPAAPDAPLPEADAPAAPDAPLPEANAPNASQPKADFLKSEDDSPKAQDTINELKTLEEQLESAFDV